MKHDKKSATIRDVADHASVSISTVSHVVNNTRHVEEGTRARILAAIGELGYRPNQLARGLRGAGSRTIGLIISDIREDFFSQLTKSIESAANERGYTVILCDSEEDVAKESLYIEMLAFKGVDGIIVAPVDSRAALRLPDGKALPLVQVDRRGLSEAHDFVGIDNAMHAGAAVRHLASLGRARIGFVCHERTISTMSERVEGYTKAMRDLGDSEGPRVLSLPSKGGNPKGQVRKWISSNEGLDAIICGNANICATVLEALDDLGLEVPGAVALLAFDDIAWFRFLKGSVIAIRQPVERMGREALGLLVRRIEGEDFPAQEIILPAKIVERGLPPARGGDGDESRAARPPATNGGKP